MKTVFLVLVMLWGASVAAVALGILCMWLFDRVRAEPEQTVGRTGYEPSAALPRPRLRVLEPDPDLLVPWAAVRSSKRRLGVEEAAPFRGEAATDERTAFRGQGPVH
jgi:hypothetical protein